MKELEQATKDITTLLKLNLELQSETLRLSGERADLVRTNQSNVDKLNIALFKLAETEAKLKEANESKFDAIMKMADQMILQSKKHQELNRVKKDLDIVVKTQHGQVEINRKLSARLEEIVKYCEPHQEIMWAKYITGIAKSKADWRDA